MEGQPSLPQGQGSELAALLAQIEAEQLAAHRALHGFASGSARHEFITSRMDRLGQISNQLIAQLGPEQALPLIIEAMNKTVQDEGQSMVE